MARPKPFADQPVWTAEDDHALLGLYVKGVALNDLADRLGWGYETVRSAMVRLELERLPRGRQAGQASSPHCDRSRQ